MGAAPGALILRSDLIRKSLLGILPLERLGPEGYTDSITREVYRRLSERAAAAVKAGHAVIVDAVFANRLDRGVMADAARDAGVLFTGLWLDADRETLAARLRHRTNDPSDATPEVLRRQLARDVGGVLWHRIDASVDEAAVQRSAENVLARERCELWRPDTRLQPVS